MTLHGSANQPVVRQGSRSDIGAVVTLHASSISEGFLVALGPRFLGRLYMRILRSKRALLLVAQDEGGGICGFVAASEDTRAFYADFLLRDGLVAGLVALPQVLRAPRRVFETLRYGTAGDDAALPSAEIFALAVAAPARGLGVASRLLIEALAELGLRGVQSARVVTGSQNEAALRTYEKAGFETRGRLEVHRGVAQEVLVWG